MHNFVLGLLKDSKREKDAAVLLSDSLTSQLAESKSTIETEVSTYVRITFILLTDMHFYIFILLCPFLTLFERGRVMCKLLRCLWMYCCICVHFYLSLYICMYVCMYCIIIHMYVLTVRTVIDDDVPYTRSHLLLFIVDHMNTIFFMY